MKLAKRPAHSTAVTKPGCFGAHCIQVVRPSAPRSTWRGGAEAGRIGPRGGSGAPCAATSLGPLRLVASPQPHPRRLRPQRTQASGSSRDGYAPPDPVTVKTTLVEHLLTYLNVVSTLGTVGGAVAALVTEQLLFAYFPLVLPVVALLAGVQRERIRSKALTEAINEQLEEMSCVFAEQQLQQQQPVELSDDAIEALEALADAVRAQAGTSAEKLTSLNETVSSLETALRSSGRASRDAARETADMSQRLRQVAPQIAEQVVRLVEERSSSNVELVDTRLQRVEANLGSLSDAQEEGLRRLARGLADSVDGMGMSIMEVIESNRRRQLVSPDQLLSLPSAATGFIGSGDTPAVNLTAEERERLRMMLEDEVERALQELASSKDNAQRLDLARMEDQWSLLDERLAGLQATLVGVLEEQPRILQSIVDESLDGISMGSIDDQGQLQDLKEDSEAILRKVGGAAAGVEEVARYQAQLLEEVRVLREKIGAGLVQSTSSAGEPKPSSGALAKSELTAELGPIVDAVDGISQQVAALSSQPGAALDPGGGQENAALTKELKKQAAANTEMLSSMKDLMSRMETLSKAVEAEKKDIPAASQDSGVEAEEGAQGTPQLMETWIKTEQPKVALEELFAGRQAEVQTAGAVASPLRSDRSSGAMDMDQQPAVSDSSSSLEEAAASGSETRTDVRKASGSLGSADVGAPRSNGSPGEEDLTGPAESGEASGSDGPADKAHADEEANPWTSSSADSRSEVDTLLKEGLELMREGRRGLQEGMDPREAEEWLMDAESAFAEALEIDPDNIKAQGNLGNVLLSRGQLKILLIEQNLAADTDDAEAEGLLIDAGRCFRGVLKEDIGDERALCNWAAALCARADLVGRPAPATETLSLRRIYRTRVDVNNPEVAAKLYNAAVEKYEAVLEKNPKMVPALKSCGLALRSLALCSDPSDSDTALLLEDAVYSLELARKEKPEDDSIKEELKDTYAIMKEMGLPPKGKS